jgi:hypothetical protein
MVVELAHGEGLVLPTQQGPALRSLVSSLLLRLDALLASGLLTSEQFAVLRNKAWSQDFALIRSYESVRRGTASAEVWPRRGGMGRAYARLEVWPAAAQPPPSPAATPHQVRGAEDHAVASLLLSRFNFLRRPGLHVVHVASEMVPIAKVGGLGDVVTGLARAHQQRCVGSAEPSLTAARAVGIAQAVCAVTRACVGFTHSACCPTSLALVPLPGRAPICPTRPAASCRPSSSQSTTSATGAPWPTCACCATSTSSLAAA